MTARVAAALRGDAPRRLAVAALAAMLYRRLDVLHLSLDRPVADVSPRLPVSVDVLRESEVADYLRFRPGADARAIRRRMESGSRCFVARHEGRIVHAGWVTGAGAWIDYLGCAMPLAHGDAYQFGSFTDPAFRGRGVAAARVAAMARALRAEGYRRLVACVLPENADAWRPLERVRYRVAGRISVVGFGPWRRLRLRLADAETPAPGGYWDDVLADMRAAPPIEAWRAYMRQVYADLVSRWFAAPDAGRALKTDLFEEAISDHDVLSALGPGSVGVDVSPAIAAAARQRLGAGRSRHRFVVGDLRAIPLRSGSMARVLAGSSLDHFADKADIGKSLAELARLLMPGGVLILTLDNPHNPVVWLRNHLPFGPLKRLGLVPYYVGATYGRAEARAWLEAVGFDVTDVTAVAHAPRAPAIWLAGLVGRRRGGAVADWLERFLWGFERLGRWATRNQTGYYLALRARKRGPAPAER